eukprot:scaffold216616_cov25-Prasinocladus_malaysianus.AAC.1
MGLTGRTFIVGRSERSGQLLPPDPSDLQGSRGRAVRGGPRPHHDERRKPVQHQGAWPRQHVCHVCRQQTVSA